MEVVFHLPKRVAGWQSELCIQCIVFYALGFLKHFYKNIKIALQAARGWGPNFIFPPEFVFVLVRSPCNKLKPYDKPFWGFE
jgi:hypothetical protein